MLEMLDEFQEILIYHRVILLLEIPLEVMKNKCVQEMENKRFSLALLHVKPDLVLLLNLVLVILVILDEVVHRPNDYMNRKLKGVYHLDQLS